MLILQEEFSTLPPTVLTIGSFDGVHFGHRAILARLREEARRLNAASVVVTFRSHPRVVLGQDADRLRLLTTLSEKRLLLSELGIDYLVELDFTPELASMSAAEFVDRVLIDQLRMRGIVMGYDHRFGRDGRGDYPFMKALGAQRGFDALLVDQQQFDSQHISSTQLRKMIGQGRMDEASRYLTYDYLMIGSVDEKGCLAVEDPRKMIPADGVYRIGIDGYGEADLSIVGGALYLSEERLFGKNLIIRFLYKK